MSLRKRIRVIDSSSDSEEDIVPTPVCSRTTSPTMSSIDKLSDAMTRILQNSVQVQSPFSQIQGDAIPLFDPADYNQNIETWVRRVDELRELFHWTEDATTYLALAKLRGRADKWYRSLPTIKYSWNEWKTKLIYAFPSKRDFHSVLAEMMARTKRSDETYAAYYYDKYALLNSCKIFGGDAVSCIIAGISEPSVSAAAQAANFSSPEELFHYLRNVKTASSGSARQKLPHLKKHYRRDRPQNGFASTRSSPLSSGCFICNEKTHYARQCPQKNKQRGSSSSGSSKPPYQMRKNKETVA